RLQCVLPVYLKYVVCESTNGLDSNSIKLFEFRTSNNSVSIPLISALKGTLQGVSRRSPGRSRPQDLGRYGLTRQPNGRTRQPEG
ncbi:MAG: hypothetical protein ACK53Y_10495, partial [bacterium]